MRKNLLSVAFLMFALVLCAPAVCAQGKAKTGPDPSTIRDPDLEKDSLHNLEVARNYFKLKKAYVAALKRCEEIIAGNSNFARIEEVLLIAGESSLSLADKKGKQAPSLYVTFVARIVTHVWGERKVSGALGTVRGPPELRPCRGQQARAG